MVTTQEYYQKNREKILKETRDRYQANPEKYIAYQKEYRNKNRELVAQKTRAKREARQLEAIAMLGGKCQRCNQEFDPVCYDFHHIDPTQKEVTIGENMLIGEDRFFTEVKKCILLCSNCHRLTHKELRTNAN